MSQDPLDSYFTSDDSSFATVPSMVLTNPKRAKNGPYAGADKSGDQYTIRVSKIDSPLEGSSKKFKAVFLKRGTMLVFSFKENPGVHDIILRLEKIGYKFIPS